MTHWLLNWYSGISIPHFDLGVQYREGENSSCYTGYSGNTTITMTFKPPQHDWIFSPKVISQTLSQTALPLWMGADHSSRRSVDSAYLLAAVILWWWNRLASWFCTTHSPLRPNKFWLSNTIGALFQLHNLEKIWDQLFITNYLMAGYGNSSSTASEIKGWEIAFHHFSLTIQLTRGSDVGHRHPAYVEAKNIAQIYAVPVKLSCKKKGKVSGQGCISGLVHNHKPIFIVLTYCVY